MNDSDLERDMRENDTEWASESTPTGVTSDPLTSSSSSIESSSTGEEYYNLSGSDNDDTVEIVSREGWGAYKPARLDLLELMNHPVVYISMSYNSDVEACQSLAECSERMRTIQKRDMDQQGLADITYNFLIGADLRVYEGRGWMIKPDKSLRYPKVHEKRLDIAYIGDYRECALPMPMFEKVIDLVRNGVKLGWVSDDFEFIGLTDVDPKEDEYDFLGEKPTKGRGKGGGRGRGRGVGRGQGRGRGRGRGRGGGQFTTKEMDYEAGKKGGDSNRSKKVTSIGDLL